VMMKMETLRGREQRAREGPQGEGLEACKRGAETPYPPLGGAAFIGVAGRCSPQRRQLTRKRGQPAGCSPRALPCS
jgi:hypothetical protein